MAFVSGKFNVLHPGHVRLLRFAKEISDFLVVGILGENSISDIYLSDDDRLLAVLAVSWVDHAFILHTNPVEAVKIIKPNFVVKGREHEKRLNPETAVAEKYGGSVIFGSGDTRFSSLSLINYEMQDGATSVADRDRNFEERHGITSQSISSLINKFEDLKVIILGETIIDEYVDCQPIGMSAEDPTMVVTPIESRLFLGGAGIVAAHATNTKANVEFISVLGDDETGDLTKNFAEDYKISSSFLIDHSRPTPRKKRFRADGKTLLRINDLRDHEISRILQDQIMDKLSDLIPQSDILMYADFNYGMLPQELVSWATNLCIEHSVPVVADSQSSSQIGDISRFKKCLLITPTEREARIATRNYRDGLVVLTDELRRISGVENIVITLGSEGAFVHAPDTVRGLVDEKISALNLLPRDVSGAGDALFVYSSLGLVAGGDIWTSVYLGSIAAACQVARVGNLPLETEEFLEEFNW